MKLIDLTVQIPHERSPDLDNCIDGANSGIGHGDERWRLLWRDPMQQEHLQAVDVLVQSLLPCKNLLLLGIGGSALGAMALHSALCHDQAPSFFVLDNIDPNTVQEILGQILKSDPSLSQTVVAIISKSGETAEIAALSMVVESTLSNATFVAITGKEGSLREHAIEKGWATLDVPTGVGGRFSVLSPVGLFPAAMCGIDVQSLLDGAASMDDRCMQLQDNPAATLASGLVAALHGGQDIHVMMPYCDRLMPFAQWYVQLWAESLGKIGTDGTRIGPTPIAARGTTDQHSTLQLWKEGPANKVIGFINVASQPNVLLGDEPIGPSTQWLCGQTLEDLFHAEETATHEVVKEAGQSTWILTLPELNAHSVGQLIALWQDTVAIAGRLLKVNPYDQPGVEIGKQLTRDSFR
jgi:glucose-6-phosphate isomerase